MKRIGRADIEFYEAALLVSLARALAGSDLQTLSTRARLRWYGRALDILEALLNDETTVRAMYRFSSLKVQELPHAT